MTFGVGAGGPERYKNIISGNSRKFRKQSDNDDEPLSIDINNNP